MSLHSSERHKRLMVLKSQITLEASSSWVVGQGFNKDKTKDAEKVQEIINFLNSNAAIAPEVLEEFDSILVKATPENLFLLINFDFNPPVVAEEDTSNLGAYERAIEGLKNTIMSAKVAGNKVAAYQGEQVLIAAQLTCEDHPEKIKEITTHVNNTSNLILKPTPENKAAYLKSAEKVHGQDWGKKLGGAMLGFAGLAVIGLSVAATILTGGLGSGAGLIGGGIGLTLLGHGVNVYKRGRDNSAASVSADLLSTPTPTAKAA